MADRGHELTDEMLKELESNIHDEYEQAVKDMQAKLSEYLATFEKQDAVQKELLKAGKITEEEYKSWAYRHKMMGKRWEEMRDVLAEDMHNTNEIAHDIAKGRMPDVYALNMNYATYDIEHGGRIDTGFTLYDHDTAAYLLSGQRDLMPEPSTAKAKKIAANKDMQWNMKKIQSAVLQGVLQGESPYAVAKRLASVGQMNENASVRYARTMTTSAQNAGRYNAFRRAKDLGVDLTIEWSATLDGRTRHEHRMMHGQRRNVDEPFEVSGVKILYPAQAKLNGSNIPQELIWNCRCTLLSWVKGFEGETVKQSAAMGDMSFEEWQNAKESWSNKESNQALKKKYKESIKSQNKLPTFTPARTKQEAVEYAKRFADNVNFDGISLDNINAINEQLTILTTKYPTNKLRTLESGNFNATAKAHYDSLRINGKKLGKALADETARFEEQRRRNEESIALIEKRFAGKKLPYSLQSSVDKLKKALMFKRYGVQSSYENHVGCTVTHEYGHILSDQYFGMLNHERANPNYATNWQLRQMCRRWDDAFNRAVKSGDIYSLSDYGSANVREFFAESFVAREMGEILPDYVESLMSEVLRNGIM